MKGYFKGYGLLILGVIGAIVLGTGIMFATGAISIATSDFRGEVKKHELVEANGQYRIAAYDRFYDDCAAIQGVEGSISVLASELATTKDSARSGQLNAAVTANKAQRQTLIAQYNADARKGYTAGQFRASDLPFNIDPNLEHTTC